MPLSSEPDSPEARATETDSGTQAGGDAGPSSGGDHPSPIPGYRIVQELGAGGMGRVYEALDEKLGRRVALKVLAPFFAASDAAGQRFEHEAWIAGRLDHPSLVKVFDRGRSGGVSWFAMQYLDGGSLADVLRELRANGRDASRGLVFGSRSYVVWALERVLEAARGLEHAHRRGVVHRDVKPANLLLSREQGSVAVADFGIALDADSTRLTRTGAAVGTVAYMAPEQILGQRERIGPWTDVYALGATLFELLTLHLPYAAPSEQLYAQQVLTGEVRRARELNARVGSDLETVVRKALAKEPADRYPSAADFADDLTNVLEFRPVRARRPGWRERALKWIRRRPMHAAFAGLLVVAVPTVAVLGVRAAASRKIVLEAQVRQMWRELRHLDDRADQGDELVGRLGELLRIDPRHVPALAKRARILIERGQKASPAAQPTELLERALADVNRIASLEAGSAWPFEMRAEVLDDLGQDAAAAEARREAETRRTAQPTDGDLRYDAGVAWRKDDYRRAVELLDRFLERSPTETLEIYRRGHARVRLDDLQGALVDLRVAVALEPEDTHFLAELGRTLTLVERHEEAEGYLRRVVANDPDLYQAHEALAANAIWKGLQAVAREEPAAATAHFEEAEREAERAIEIDPESAWGQVSLGMALKRQAQMREPPDPLLLERAIGHYEQARRLYAEMKHPLAYDHATVFVNLCDAWLLAGRPERALEVCIEATRIQPDSSYAAYNLAGVNALLGKRKEALAALERDFDLGDRDHAYLRKDPWFESLRGDPRFTALLSQMQRCGPSDSALPHAVVE